MFSYMAKAKHTLEPTKLNKQYQLPRTLLKCWCTCHVVKHNREHIIGEFYQHRWHTINRAEVKHHLLIHIHIKGTD